MAAMLASCDVHHQRDFHQMTCLLGPIINESYLLHLSCWQVVTYSVTMVA